MTIKIWLKNRQHFLKALLAVLFYGYPARNLKVIGVTGTDGKTTTSSIIYHILKTARKKTAVVTTVAAFVGEKKIETGLHVTTPNPWILQRIIKSAVSANCEYLVLEATSHGFDQHRLMGTNISMAVVTNITHEHLDYHKTYLRYLTTKARIFRHAKTAILNKTDSSYENLIRYLKKDTKLIPYNFESISGLVKKTVDRRFPEEYNQLNATAAILVAKELGIKKSDIVKAIRSFPGVPGRMETIKNNEGLQIIIDFAHTPNALENVLNTLRGRNKKGKLIAVFGCAGERDVEKRPMMAGISTRLADLSIFTAEDPRHEDLHEIIKEMEKGVSAKDKKKYIIIPERGKAIAYAIQEVAKRGDIVVICGKGHEKSLAYGDEEYPWSDRKAVLWALRKKVLSIEPDKNK